MIFKLWLILMNAILSLVGYQTSVDHFKSLSASCVKVGSTTYLEIDAEIPDSALFFNSSQLLKQNLKSNLHLGRDVAPQKKIFIDKIIVSTTAMKSIQEIPLLSGAWHKIRISLGQILGHAYTLKIVYHGSDRVIGQCALWQ